MGAWASQAKVPHSPKATPAAAANGPAHAQPPDEEVGGPPGDELHAQLDQQHPLVEDQQQGEGEERPALHLPGQGLPTPS